MGRPRLRGSRPQPSPSSSLPDDTRPRREVYVLSLAPQEDSVDKALDCQLVNLQKRRRRAVQAAMPADWVAHAVTLRLGDLRVKQVVHFFMSGLGSIENFLSLLGDPAVGQRPKENGLLTGYCGVREEVPDVIGQVNGSWVIENRLQLIATPDLVVVMPEVRTLGKIVHLVARDDAETATGPFHPPAKVAVARCVDADGGAIG